MSLLLLFFAYDLPTIQSLEDATRHPGIILKDRTGAVFATYGDLYGRTVRSEGLPPHVSQAFLAVEDARFYKHFGIDVWGLIRAFYQNYKAGQVVQGGSGITQQLAKNFLFSQKKFSFQDRSLKRKIQELLLTFWLEYKFTKRQILTLYLNRVYFGAGTYGLSAASQKYFAKSPWDLTIYESAVLAGLLKAPSRYCPLSAPERANERAQIVLNRMVEVGFLSATERQKLKDSQRNPLAQLKKEAVFGRYFGDWIMDHVLSYTQDVQEDLVVQTTLDPKMQKIAEEKIEKLVAEKGSSRSISQGALVAMTPQGAVRALVGGRDYRHSQFNRACQAFRQPGSSFKLIIFLAALEKGVTPQTLISDTPFTMGKWKPKNYKWISRGRVSMETALIYSVNACAVRLAKHVGKEGIEKMARKLGLSSIKVQDLSVALGSGEVTLLQLTAAFAVVAQEGMRCEPYGIVSIRDRQGRVLYSHRSLTPRRLIAPHHRAAMVRMLRGVVTQGTGRRSRIMVPAAGKSGTSQHYKDAWFVGFTWDLVVGVWMGNDDGRSMKNVSGGTLPAELWGAYMNQVHGYQDNR